VIVAVNGSVTPSVTRLRCVFCGIAAAASRTCALAVASCLALAAIDPVCAGVMFSAPPSASSVLATDDSAGASARSASPCSC
jgi:hypothetical protein